MFVLQALETAWAAGELGEMGLKLQFFSFEIDGLKKEGEPRLLSRQQTPDVCFCSISFLNITKKGVDETII